MDVQSVTNTPPAMNGVVSKKDDAMGREAFLNMLVAQLKNQDPLNPMDGTDFTAQLAQFSALEQMIKINENISGLQTLQTSQNNSMMLGMIGKTVEAQGNQIVKQDGTITNFIYGINGNVKVVDSLIYNSNGKIVRSMSESGIEKGEHLVTWDGKDDQGESLPDGVYTFRVIAKDSLGDPVSTETNLKGEITAISYGGDGKTVLWMDGLRVPMEDIKRIVKNP